jgi:hypothetical protein
MEPNNINSPAQATIPCPIGAGNEPAARPLKIAPMYQVVPASACTWKHPHSNPAFMDYDFLVD